MLPRLPRAGMTVAGYRPGLVYLVALALDDRFFLGVTFAANIAVEMPESEVDSTHFRILFLTALVLFLITFVFNTLAEVVRHRLRARYGNL